MKKTIVLMLAAGLLAGAAPAFADEGVTAAATDASDAAPSSGTVESSSNTAEAGGSATSGDYVENMKRDLLRGVKNVIGSPLEIPITVQEYHEKAGRPVIRHIAGLLDGGFQMATRFGSGAWDFVAAFIPGHQQGMPVDPETLF